MTRRCGRKTLRRFAANERGNVAMITAIAVIPLTLASLGAVDLTRSLAAKIELQDALDAAALAAGRSSAQDPARLQEIGQRILTQNLAGASDFTVTGSSFTFGENGKVVASVQARFSPLLGGLAGGAGALSATTEVMRANTMLEIALVLDNTGSMADSLGHHQDSKLSYLKTAASSFIDVMNQASRQSTAASPIRIALVPFSNVVRVGETYRHAAWIDQNGASPLNDQIFTTSNSRGVEHANRFTLLAQLNTSWAGCVEARQAPYDIQDAAPSATEPATLFTPFFAPDENDIFDDRGRRVTNNYLVDPTKDAKGKTLDNWGRQGAVAKYATSPSVALGAAFGPNVGCTIQPIRRLSTDFDGLKTAIGNMVAVGDTNIPLGLIWGWHALSPKAPFADGVAYLKPKHKKIVVLMTDGQNTIGQDSTTFNRSNYSSVGYVWQGRVLDPWGSPLTRDSDSGERTAALDDRLKKLCANMKAADVGVEIYAIGVGVSSTSRDLLRTCASGADHYFNVTAGSDLNAAFQSIANQIAQLHLAK